MPPVPVTRPILLCQSNPLIQIKLAAIKHLVLCISAPTFKKRGLGCLKVAMYYKDCVKNVSSAEGIDRITGSIDDHC